MKEEKLFFCGKLVGPIVVILLSFGCFKLEKYDEIWERGFLKKQGEYLQFLVNKEPLGSGLEGFRNLLENADSYPQGLKLRSLR